MKDNKMLSSKIIQRIIIITRLNRNFITDKINMFSILFVGQDFKSPAQRFFVIYQLARIALVIIIIVAFTYFPIFAIFACLFTLFIYYFILLRFKPQKSKFVFVIVSLLEFDVLTLYFIASLFGINQKLNLFSLN